MSNTTPKRYELIKDTPFMKAGAIYELMGARYGCVNFNEYKRNDKYSSNSFDLDEVLDKDWFKEVKEKEWGIVNYRYKYNGTIVTSINVEYHNLYEINSVKRLSDGEVFSIGDEIVWYEHVLPLKEIKVDGDKCFFHCYRDKINGDYVHAPIHRVQKLPPKKQRIEVEFFDDVFEMNLTRIRSNQPIPTDKFPLIKSAIERCLNNDMFFVSDESGQIPYHTYTKQQLEEAERKAFEAGRSSFDKCKVVEFPLFHASYPTFESYKQSLKSKP